jgi:hypothetical protein
MSASIDYRNMLNPSAARPGSASYVLAHLAGRTFWHKLYDNTPKLAQALGEQGSVNALLAFLADCDRLEKSLDWRMPLMFLRWLGEQRPNYVDDDSEHALECLSAATAAWAGEVTHVGMYRIILACNQTGFVVGAMRPLTIDSGSRVFRLQLEAWPRLDARFQYALSSRADQWAVDEWRAATI